MLAIEGLRFRYRRGGDELFDGISHTFHPGAVTATTGPSGRGKSTLLYVLGLLLRPTAGRVLIDGSSVVELTDPVRSHLRASRMGFVFQDAVLDPTRTILDAVVEPALYAGRTASEMRTRAMELLEGLGVAHRASHRPGQISGGQAQRVAVCRALVGDPAIVLADEPTGNLDRTNAAGVLDALTDAAHQGRTVVIATHDPYVVGRSDHTFEL